MVGHNPGGLFWSDDGGKSWALRFGSWRPREILFWRGADVGAGENGAAGGEPGDFVFLSRGYGAGEEKAIAALGLGLPMSV